MARAKRFTVSVDKALYDRLVGITDNQEPHLPKRYVVELALRRLFEELDDGQLDLGLERHVKKR